MLPIQGLYDRHLNRRINSNKLKQLTEYQLETDFSDPNVRLAIGRNLIVQQCLAQQINVIEASLKKQLKLAPEFKQLTSIEVIGLTLGLTIMLETGDISRFSEIGHYASYCHCVSGAIYSNGKKKSNTNAKNGNKYLACKFIEVANFAIRYSDTVKRYYQKKVVIDRKTVAHKLARACFYMLRDQVEFDVNKAFGCSK
jgi:transposase